MPHLGVVKVGDAPGFVVADIPGLIEGAHEGQGMGIQFLRHVERTAVLLHIIDVSDDARKSAWKNYTAINRELTLYSPALAEKPQIVAINKIDLPHVRAIAKKAVAQFAKKGIMLHPFSALTGEGLQVILEKMATLLQNADTFKP